MSKKLKAAVAGLAFVAGCEVGIALQLMKMVRDYTIKEKALDEAQELSEDDSDTETFSADDSVEEVFSEDDAMDTAAQNAAAAPEAL